jgi:hypothetical protein
VVTTAPKSSAPELQDELATKADTITNLEDDLSHTSLDIQSVSLLGQNTAIEPGNGIDGVQSEAVEMQDLQHGLEAEIQPSRSEVVTNQDETIKAVRGLSFWCIILALCVTGILSALEGTIVSTALPTIMQDLGGAELYIWSVNGYFLAR